jgi:quercetin dioxygenase-like cupin family protein
MKISKIADFTGGWFIGNFEPALLKTDKFEVGLKIHKKGERWPVHYHKVATEYNCMVSGKMILNGQEISTGDVFVFEPNEISKSEFIEDCYVIVVKTPSIPGDKYEV